MLLGENPRLVAEHDDEVDEAHALHAALDKFSPDERVTIRTGTERLGVSKNKMWNWLKDDSFNKKLANLRASRAVSED
jgi:hypothetical protein